MFKLKLIVMFSLILVTKTVIAKESVYRSQAGDVITTFFGWNVKGKLHIRIVTKDGEDCAEFAWTGITNRKLGKKCGFITIPYNIKFYQLSSLRVSGLNSPAIIIQEDVFEGLSTSTLFSTKWVFSYKQGEKMFEECGQDVACWQRKNSSH